MALFLLTVDPGEFQVPYKIPVIAQATFSWRVNFPGRQAQGVRLQRQR
jgi:hypothetical protein